MKNITKILGIGILAVASLGIGACSEYKTEYSEIKHETAIVTLHKYVPEKTETDIGVSITNHEGGFGFGTNGFGYGLGGMNVVTGTTPEKYEVVFSGKVDFEVDNKEIFDRFKLEDKADVSYQEVYGAVYEYNEDTIEKEKLLERKFLENKFVDAQPIKE